MVSNCKQCNHQKDRKDNLDSKKKRKNARRCTYPCIVFTSLIGVENSIGLKLIERTKNPSRENVKQKKKERKGSFK